MSTQNRPGSAETCFEQVLRPARPSPLGKELPRFVFEAARRLLPGLLDTFSPIEHSIRSPAEQARRIFH